MNFSVLISVYYKENPDFLKLALESIWDNQTLKPSEIVLIKDGPLTEQLDAVIEEFKQDKPVKIVVLEKNVGLGSALAIGVEQCSNELVCRMDSDDIADQHRFEKQIGYLNFHPEVALLSANIAEFNDTPDSIVSHRKVPTSYDDILSFAKKRNPMNHMAVVFKKSAVLDAGNYQPFQGYEDYFLWVRILAKGYRAANLNENLVLARTGNNMIARRQGLKFFKEELRLQKEFMKLNFIGCPEYVRNILLRALPRLMPIVALKLIYKNLHK
ncbi:MAG: glycosyltransferase [Mangrovibacterium sp.]